VFCLQNGAVYQTGKGCLPNKVRVVCLQTSRTLQTGLSRPGRKTPFSTLFPLYFVRFEKGVCQQKGRFPSKKIANRQKYEQNDTSTFPFQGHIATMPNGPDNVNNSPEWWRMFLFLLPLPNIIVNLLLL
jgi:hypothetical protein